jgi:hypothetical protein
MLKDLSLTLLAGVSEDLFVATVEDEKTKIKIQKAFAKLERIDIQASHSFFKGAYFLQWIYDSFDAEELVLERIKFSRSTGELRMHSEKVNEKFPRIAIERF